MHFEVEIAKTKQVLTGLLPFCECFSRFLEYSTERKKKRKER